MLYGLDLYKDYLLLNQMFKVVILYPQMSFHSIHKLSCDDVQLNLEIIHFRHNVMFLMIPGREL